MREKRWLLCFLVAVCCTFSTWALPSQDKTVTLKLHNVSIESVLDAVKKQTFVNMLYNSQMFKCVPPVSNILFIVFSFQFFHFIVYQYILTTDFVSQISCQLQRIQK